jgi:hypothetical protein
MAHSWLSSHDRKMLGKSFAFITVERPETVFSINYAMQQTLEVRPTKVI